MHAMRESRPAYFRLHFFLAFAPFLFPSTIVVFLVGRLTPTDCLPPAAAVTRSAWRDATEIGPPQVRCAIRRRAMQENWLQIAEFSRIERAMHCVARFGVRQLEGEQFVCRQTMTGSP